jgi:hypothetical protein
VSLDEDGDAVDAEMDDSIDDDDEGVDGVAQTGGEADAEESDEEEEVVVEVEKEEDGLEFPLPFADGTNSVGEGVLGCSCEPTSEMRRHRKSCISRLRATWGCARYSFRLPSSIILRYSTWRRRVLGNREEDTLGV